MSKSKTYESGNIYVSPALQWKAQQDKLLSFYWLFLLAFNQLFH